MRFRKLIYRLKNDKRYSYFEELKKNLYISHHEMKALQDNNIKNLIRHAYNNTQYYKKTLDSLGLSPEEINSKEDLRKLPVLTKKIIKNNISRLMSNDQYSRGLTKYISGGTSSEPSVIFKSPYFFQMSQAAFYRDNLLAGWNPSDKWVWIWGSPHEHKRISRSFISKLGLFINRTLLLNAYKYSEEDYFAWVDRILRFKPKVLYGYSGVILGFAKFLLENEVNLSSLKSVICTSEVLKCREIIEQAFGCNVYNQYGCREIFSIAIESQKDVMRLSDDTVALNIYSDNSFIVTALYSYGFPLINYKLGDFGLSYQYRGIQNDNYPFSHINISIGRETSRFITKEGHIVDSPCLECYMYSFDLPIDGQQIIQKSPTLFCINYIPGRDFYGNYYKRIVRRCLKEYFGEGLSIYFNPVQQLPKEKSGKTLIFKRNFD